jgi:uncharacterized protein YjbI with pentapeptide repeats
VARPVGNPSTPRLPSVLNSGTDPVLCDDAEWSDLEVRGDFSSQSAEAVEVSACRLAASSFTGVDLHRVRLTDALFVDCELSGAAFHEAVFTRVEFVQCRMLGVGLAQARLRHIRFVECRLDGADFRMSDGDSLLFDRCSLVGADFYAAGLGHVRIFDSDLTDVEFSKATFRDGRLHGSKLDRLRGASNLRNVTIDSAQIVSMAYQVFGSVGIHIDDEREPTS